MVSLFHQKEQSTKIKVPYISCSSPPLTCQTLACLSFHQESFLDLCDLFLSDLILLDIGNLSRGGIVGKILKCKSFKKKSLIWFCMSIANSDVNILIGRIKNKQADLTERALRGWVKVVTETRKGTSLESKRTEEFAEFFLSGLQLFCEFLWLSMNLNLLSSILV